MDLNNLTLNYVHDSNPKVLDGADIHVIHPLLHKDVLKDTVQEPIIINNNTINVLQDYSGLLNTNHSIFCSSTPVNLLSFTNSTNESLFSDQSLDHTSTFSVKNETSAECQTSLIPSNHIGSCNIALGSKLDSQKSDNCDIVMALTLPTCGTQPPAQSSSSSLKVATPRSKLAKCTERRDKIFTCQTCNKSFGYKHVLQHHERIHTGEKPFECPHCQKRFTRDHHLKTHLRLHTAEKPYHCDQCDRYFVQMGNLRRHLRVHTGERPYPCELCPSRFSDSNQLKHHLLIHRGEKPFECTSCLRRFRRRHRLLHHKCAGSVDSSHAFLCKPVFEEEKKHSKNKTECKQNSRQKCKVAKQVSKSVKSFDFFVGTSSVKATQVKTESRGIVETEVKKS